MEGEKRPEKKEHREGLTRRDLLRGAVAAAAMATGVPKTVEAALPKNAEGETEWANDFDYFFESFEQKHADKLRPARLILNESEYRDFIGTIREYVNQHTDTGRPVFEILAEESFANEVMGKMPDFNLSDGPWLSLRKVLRGMTLFAKSVRKLPNK